MFKGQTLTDSSLVDMSLSQRISEDLTRALKAKDEIRISSIRMLKSNLKNEQVKIGRELNDEEIQSILSSLIRKGQEAVEEFRKGNREDLAAKEEEEIKISGWSMAMTTIFALIFALALFKLIPLAVTRAFYNHNIFSNKVLFNLVDGITRIILFIWWIYNNFNFMTSPSQFIKFYLLTLWKSFY